MKIWYSKRFSDGFSQTLSPFKRFLFRVPTGMYIKYFETDIGPAATNTAMKSRTFVNVGFRSSTQPAFYLNGSD